MSAFAANETKHAPFPIPGLRLIPLALLQPILNKIGKGFASSHPELFARLGHHSEKCFVIDPLDLPFVLALWPKQNAPTLRAFRRDQLPHHDARIAGTFINLFDMIDGQIDGDALFFTRDLDISGDTEAIVALRNALDDIDGGAVNNIANAFGPFSRPAMLAIAMLRNLRSRSSHN